ncbi:MAG: hypothetical protein QOC92_3126, partial [Acidimicrobiaceae bacterium]
AHRNVYGSVGFAIVPGWGSLLLVVTRGSVYAMVLTDRDRAILDFERNWWSEPGRKELAIRERFDLSTTRYYEILNELLDAPEALEYDPLVVRRLRRVRDRRRRARFEGRSMVEPRP